MLSCARGIPMKKKINRMMVLIAGVAILLTMVLSTAVYYDLFEKQVWNDLQNNTELLRRTVDLNKLEELESISESSADALRITLIAADGEVLFDNAAESGTMTNHADRPEIVSAEKSGEGQAVRTSETLSETTYYYAVRLEDGSILRLSKETRSIYSVFARTIPVMLGILVLLLLFCTGAAHFLTKKLLEPIDRLAHNLDDAAQADAYEELQPFLSMIRSQHADILKSAGIRQDFTANVSHELKTPLTSISGYAELIETGMASEEDTVRFAHGIHSSANRLLTLINDIIRLSELDSEQTQIQVERVDLYAVAKDNVEMLSMAAAKHDVEIDLAGSQCYVNGDRQMLEELVYNLCDNAIRYNNPGGRVKVETYFRSGLTHLVVSDTGIGISKEHQERIFERFYRVDKSRSKSTGGTGLGLAIVKHIVAKHGAELNLSSEPGKGTRIEVIFP